MKTTSGLDITDIALLRALQDNSRLTIKELAAKIHLSTTPTFERVRRLEKEGYITKYMAVLDAEKIDCGFVAFCYLKMKQHTYENSIRIMEAVKNIPEIAECYNISGDYDFLLKIYTSNMKAYQKFILRILGDLDCIGSLNSSFVLGEVKNTHQLPLPAISAGDNTAG
ncbi:MAG: Lrp/AsnC family transcriptional regulator [Staphylococcus sp.]|nr:Lrp/AsnC family transcriptional regulator [Staphylococcus sp.]